MLLPLIVAVNKFGKFFQFQNLNQQSIIINDKDLATLQRVYETTVTENVHSGQAITWSHTQDLAEE